MGSVFDKNGKYVGWSNLFDYSTSETLKASQELPMPTGKRLFTKINDFELKALNNFNVKVEENKITFSLKGKESLGNVVIFKNGNIYEVTQNYSDKNSEELNNIFRNAIYNVIPKGSLISIDLPHYFNTLFPDLIFNDRYLKKPGRATYNLTKDLIEISKIIDPADRIYKYTLILNNIQNLEENEILLVYDDPKLEGVANKVVQDLQLHEQTKMSPNDYLDALKNYISHNIGSVILDVRNMDQAYSPILMKDLHKGADKSPKGKKIKSMSMMNPLTKFVMLELNMTGKSVIGIAANGEKVFFNASWYWNEGIHSRDPEWIKNLQFSHTYKRILGRADGNLKTVTKTTLANVNFENFEDLRDKFNTAAALDTELRQRLGVTDSDIKNKTSRYYKYLLELQDTDTYADDMISLLLSAATDRP